MPKIQWLYDCSKGNIYEWVKTGQFLDVIPCESNDCFYRFYSFHQFNLFLSCLREMLLSHSTIGQYVRKHCNGDAMSAISSICRWFADSGTGHIVPRDTKSPCKRICLFLRWMVRNDSPVDLGLWSDFIDRRTLIIPLDTHVHQQGRAMGITARNSADITTAKEITEYMKTIFPDDPTLGDFALFGLGVDEDGK